MVMEYQMAWPIFIQLLFPFIGKGSVYWNSLWDLIVKIMLEIKFQQYLEGSDM